MRIWFTSRQRSKASKKTHDSREKFTNPEEITPVFDFQKFNHFDYTAIEFEGGVRTGTRFVSSDCLFIDFDHVAPSADIEFTKEQAERLKQAMTRILEKLPYSYVAFPSSSGQGFHALVPLSKSIADKKAYEKIYVYASETIEGCDTQVKDAARYAFASVLPDGLFSYCVLMDFDKEPMDAEAVLKLSTEAKLNRKAFDAAPHSNPAEPDFSKFNISSEGSRNTECHKLACSLLNYCKDDDEAEAKFMEMTEGNGLSDSERANIFKSAVRYIGGKGEIGSQSPEAKKERRRSYITSNLITNTPKGETPLYAPENEENGDSLQGFDPSEWNGIKEAEALFMRLYSKTSLKSAQAAFRKLSHEDFNLTKDTWIAVLAQLSYWADSVISPCVAEKLPFRLDGKTPEALASACFKALKATPSACTYVPELGSYYSFKAKEGKWTPCDADTALCLMRKALSEVKALTDQVGSHDEVLYKASNKAISLLGSSSVFAKNLNSTSYTAFQKGQEDSIATDKGVWKIEKDGLEFMPSKASDMVLEVAGVDLNAQVPADRKGLFEKTLKEIIPNPALRDWFQIAIGSQILGEVPKDQTFYIWQGDAKNGKSTLFNAIASALGDYAGLIRPEALSNDLTAEQQAHERAEVMGKRFVLVQEPREDLQLNASQIKQLCSSDKITASKKYVNAFYFWPTHHLNLICNTLPQIKNPDDEGLRRRIKVFHFTQSFYKNPDPSLPAKLEEDRPEILRWLIEGAQKFLELGCVPENETVTQWSLDYLAKEDGFSAFLSECFEKSDPSTYVLCSDLYYLYDEYRKVTPGSPYLSSKSIGMKMGKKGVKSCVISEKGKTARIYRGLSVNSNSTVMRMLENTRWKDASPVPSHEIEAGDTVEEEAPLQPPMPETSEPDTKESLEKDIKESRKEGLSAFESGLVMEVKMEAVQHLPSDYSNLTPSEKIQAQRRAIDTALTALNLPLKDASLIRRYFLSFGWEC